MTHDLADPKACFLFARSLQSPLAPVYLSAALFILNSARLQHRSLEAFDLIVQIRKLPADTNARKLIHCTGRLYQLFPPEKLILHQAKLLPGRRRKLPVFSVSFVIKLSLLIFIFLLYSALKESYYK